MLEEFLMVYASDSSRCVLIQLCDRPKISLWREEFAHINERETGKLLKNALGTEVELSKLVLGERVGHGENQRTVTLHEHILLLFGRSRLGSRPWRRTVSGFFGSRRLLRRRWLLRYFVFLGGRPSFWLPVHGNRQIDSAVYKRHHET
jgi:hypothetical protein